MVATRDRVNWPTMRLFRKLLPRNNFTVERFFNTSTGLKEESAQAGKIPASRPAKKAEQEEPKAGACIQGEVIGGCDLAGEGLSGDDIEQ